MKRFLVLFALLFALAAPGAAQSLCTITGTLYDSTGAACNGCRLTISRARSGSTPLSQGSQPVAANASGVVSFTAVQGSFITLTGPFTIGRYNLSGGLEFYVPLQSSATLATLQTAEDALNALISSTTYAPADIPVVTKTASASLSNEFALGSLATGLLKNTTTTGVPTIAVAGTDYENPLTFAARLSRSTNTIDLAASGVTAGTCTACDLTIDTYGRVTAKANGSGGGGGTWGSITGTLSSQTDLQSALDAKQGLDADLTAIGGLSPTNDDIIQRKAGVWANRTPAQFKTDLGLATIATSGSASDLSAGTVPLARLSGITNTEIDNAAAIAYSKLNLTGAIVNGDLAGSIANAKLANSAITIAGSSTSLGSSISASTILDSIGSTRGSVLYRGASGWAILTPGTSGQVLTSNGAGADPSYQAAAGGSPGGSNTELQRNNAGVFGGISGATSDGTNVTFGSGNLLATSPVFTTSQTTTRNSIGVTSTDGIVLQNTTAATAGNQQWSPRLRLKGSGWKTNATAAAQDVEHWIESKPIQGTSAPTNVLSFNVQTNGSGGEPIFVINDTGVADGATFYLGRAWSTGPTDIYNSILVNANGMDFQFNGTSVAGLAQASRFDVYTPLKIGPSSTTAVSLRNPTSGGNTLWVTTTASSTVGGNFVLGQTATGVGTSATATFAAQNGTAPTSSPADTAQLYTADINATAGRAGFHIRNEINTAALILPGVRYKTDTGDPTDTFEGMMVINTFDNTFKVYAEGAWRTITTW